MNQFFQMTQDDDDNDILKVVDFCEIKGQNIPGMPEEFDVEWFSLRIDPDTGTIALNWDASRIPEDVANKVVLYVNDESINKKELPTMLRGQIVLNGESIPHEDPVYIAETEQEVWDYLKTL